MSEHSLLFSPSDAERWTLCPGCPPKASEEQTEHSARGTALHTFTANNFDNNDPNYDEVPESDRVDAKKALTMAWGIAEAFDAEFTLVEQKVEVLDYPDIFGTADLVFYNQKEKHLGIVDYKFGWNVVKAYMNKQLLIYALGARRLIARYGIDKITLFIIQPAQNHKPDAYELTNLELNMWEKEQLQPAHAARLEALKDPTRDNLSPGEEQCRWCDVKSTCRAFQDQNLTQIDSLLGEEVGIKKDMTLAEKYALIPLLTQWMKDIESSVDLAVKAGQKVEGAKLVRTNPHKKWADPSETEKWLKNRGLKTDDIFEKSLVSPSKANNLLGTVKMNDGLWKKFNALVVKPEGELVVVRSTDKRPEVEISKPEELLAESEIDDFINSL